MSRPLPQHVLARRALIDNHDDARPTWVRHGVAALGVSVLGLAVAGSVTVTGNAQNTAPELSVAAGAMPAQSGAVTSIVQQAGVVPPAAFSRPDSSASRSLQARSLVSAALGQSSDQRVERRLAAEHGARHAAQHEALRIRTESLTSASEAADHKSVAIKHARAKRAAQERAVKEAARERAAARRAARAAAAEAKETAAAEARRAAQRSTPRSAAHRTAVPKRAAQTVRRPHSSGSADHSGHASLPITSRYHIAARFGATGVWSRYHTGLDFAAPRGTTIRAVAPGVVTHAGAGSAGWAGRYVTIRHADGKTTLYAHMSSVSVHTGERVSGGERIGSVGMTGRTFGPHVHVELYPRGVRPGDVYHAINPAPWLRGHGLHI